jgi:hypothetical protein
MELLEKMLWQLHRSQPVAKEEGRCIAKSSATTCFRSAEWSAVRQERYEIVVSV